ncbi:MAG: sugar transferase [Candidatus Kapabacteria bacterium]|nr:sugar transferase [Candidatus Kapabacteria bacterium]
MALLQNTGSIEQLISTKSKIRSTPKSYYRNSNYYELSKYQLNYIKYYKPSFEIFLLIIMSPAILPIFMVTFLIVFFTSGAPVFFKQLRIGYAEKDFLMYKFRTMTHSKRNEYIKEDKVYVSPNGSLVEQLTEEKITWIGKYLRKASIDELPQLINILNGTMSLIGPRPVMHFFSTPYDNISYRRYSVKPGITGLYQVNSRARFQTTLDMMIYDDQYIKNIGFWSDLKIIFKTIPALFWGE